MPRQILPPVPFSNAASPTALTTWDGSGQTSEPDIIDFQQLTTSGIFNGYRFWMVNAPFPNGNATVEDPCIWASNDGATWVIPQGLTNPIATPITGNLSDPCITYDSVLKKLRVYYLNENTGTTKDILRMVESLDGITWTNDQVVLSFPNDATYYLSPTIYYNPVTTTYSMWIVHTNGSSSTFISLLKYTSSDGITWSGSTTCTTNQSTVNAANPYQLWHINFEKGGEGFVGVVSAYLKSANSGTEFLFYMRSTDAAGTNWLIDPRPILKLGSGSVWDMTNLYRSYMSIVDGQWNLWYSGWQGTVAGFGLTTQPQKKRFTIRDMGTCLYFNGSTSNVDLGNASAFNFGTGSFGMCAWVKATNNANGRVLTKNGSALLGWQLFFTNGQLTLRIDDGTHNAICASATPLFNDQRKHFIFAIRDATKLHLYMDDYEIANVSSTAVTGTLNNSVDVFVGQRGDGVGKFTGFIDEPRLFNFAPNATQRNFIFENGDANNTVGAVGYWPFDEGSGTTATDASGNGNNGTISNATYSSDVFMKPRSIVANRTSAGSRNPA